MSAEEPLADRQAAFEAACVCFSPVLYGFALRLTRRPEDAAEIVQETLLRAYRTFDNFEEGSNARAWLFQILHSVFVNRCRRRRRESSIPLDRVEAALAAEAGRGVPDPQARMPDGEILGALEALPERYRSVVTLVDMHDHSYEETAAVLACPVGTVCSRLARGRKLLFVRLYDYARRIGLLRY